MFYSELPKRNIPDFGTLRSYSGQREAVGRIAAEQAMSPSGPGRKRSGDSYGNDAGNQNL